MDLDRFQQELALEINKAIIRDIKDDPTARLINLDKVTIEEVKSFLHQSGAITWSMGFTVTSSPGDENAAMWFIQQLGRFYDYQAHRTSNRLAPSSS